MSLESSDAVANYYGAREILGRELKPTTEVAREIKNVSAKDVRKVAIEIFQNKNLNLAIVGPFKGSAKFKKILKL